jgi:septal ring factor EnvC (AmiA/AmiB activator)
MSEINTANATPGPVLRKRLMDSAVSKTELEWYAAREIEALERQLAERNDQLTIVDGHLGQAYGEIERLKNELIDTRQDLERVGGEQDGLKKALKALHSAIYNVRKDIGTQFPALTEAWGLAYAELCKLSPTDAVQDNGGVG